MNLGLKDRVVLVTGGSKGIGAGIVKLLAEEGARVAFCARASEDLTRLETETCRTGVCRAHVADIFDAVAIERVVREVAEEFGGIDVLVNNAGGAIRFGGFEELSDDDWRRAFELNVMSVVRFTRAALPYLRRSTLKRVINISSISAAQPGMFNPHYTTTKAAVVNLGKQLANQLAGEGILVNTVCPGPVHSEAWNANVERIAARDSIAVDDARARVEMEECGKVPLGCVGEPGHVAAAVAFLASPQSAWTTGACFHIDGGKLAVAY